MARLIDAVDAAEIVSEKHGIPLSELVDTFCEVPTVDAVPMVHGRWIEHMNKFICTNCKGRALLHFGGIGHCLSNYCPNCGARMDLKEESDA